MLEVIFVLFVMQRIKKEMDDTLWKQKKGNSST